MESSKLIREEHNSELNKYLSSEWNNNNPRISRHNTMSRRFFPSSNFTISSTASSPGYTFKDEIDPSTYCFSTALKALQARSGYYHNSSWECSSSSPISLTSREGFALNSKWNEAEKYICNPLSGKFPLECLSSKSLTARSFRYYSSSSNRITMSAPLVFSSSNKPFSSPTLQIPLPQEEEKKKEGRTRDVGTQSTPPYVSSSSPSPASTPSIMERSIKRVGESSPVSISKTKSDEDDQVEEEKVKEREKTKIVTVTTAHERDEEKVCSKRKQQGGCFSWTCMTTRFLRNHDHRNKTDKPTKYHFKPC